MKSTPVSQINYDNLDNAKIIEDALKETEVLDIEREEQKVPQQTEQQYQQEMPQQIPPQQYQQMPSQQYQQMPPQQYQQMPQQQYPQQYQQMPQQQYSQQYQQMPPQQFQQQISPQNEKNENNILKESPILKNLQHCVILFMFLILFNNSGFKNFLSKIPFTINEDGTQTIFMYFIIFLLICFLHFFYLNIFN